MIENEKFWWYINDKINFEENFKLRDKEKKKDFIKIFLKKFIFKKSDIQLEELKRKKSRDIFDDPISVIRLDYKWHKNDILVWLFLNELWKTKLNQNKFIFDYNYFRKLEIWKEFKKFLWENILSDEEAEVYFYNHILYILIRYFITNNYYLLSNVEEKFEQVKFINLFWTEFNFS